MGLAIYWSTLVGMPKTIMNYLRSSIFNFLWWYSYGNYRSHLVDWKTLSRPYDLGGWNIKNLDWFSTTLRLKSLWLVLNGEGIWSHIVKFKYLINWFNGQADIFALELEGWCNNIRSLQVSFSHLEATHVYREYNTKVDCLYKEALGLISGYLHYFEFIEGECNEKGSFQFY